MEPILKVDHLSFSYDKKTPVLEDVSFSVGKGEYACLVGHNGSGKSTIAKILMGLLPNFEGGVTLFSLELNRENLYSIRSREGIVFQNPDNQFVGSTVEDDIAFGLENKNVKPTDIRVAVEKFAREVGMIDFLAHEPEKLSGGQKQRVAIAGVLAMGPDLVIFDEATAMLDPKGKKEVRDVVQKLKNEKPELTILSITHDIEEAYLADHVVVLSDGKIVADGNPKDVFKERDVLKKARLRQPFLLEAKEAFLQEGINVPESVDTIDALGEFLW